MIILLAAVPPLRCCFWSLEGIRFFSGKGAAAIVLAVASESWIRRGGF